MISCGLERKIEECILGLRAAFWVGFGIELGCENNAHVLGMVFVVVILLMSAVLCGFFQCYIGEFTITRSHAKTLMEYYSIAL